MTSSTIITRTIDRRIIAIQLAGGIVGLAVAQMDFWFLDFWIGGALASPIAILLAVAWELRIKEPEDSPSELDSESIPLNRVGLAIVISILLAGMAVLQIQDSRVAQTNLTKLSKLPAESVRRIDIRMPFTDEVILEIEDPEAIRDFAVAARDAQTNWMARIEDSEHIQPKHVTVVAKTGESWSFEWSQSSRTRMFGMFIEVTEDAEWITVSKRGKFASTSLRDWFRKHVEPHLEAKDR